MLLPQPQLLQQLGRRGQQLDRRGPRRWVPLEHALEQPLLPRRQPVRLLLLLLLPFCFAVAARVVPAPHALVQQLARLLLSFLRSVPEIIMGILFVAAVGFGALPGVLALGLHSVGMVGKFYAEAIEHSDPRPAEAARAAGAGPLQIIQRAILPQVLPQLADITLYRWEYHFRASAVLGIVGAGGIGFELIAALRLMAYDQVSAILLAILACVVAVDATGAALRRRLR